MFYIFLFLLGTSPFYSSHISLSFAHTFEFDECTFVIAAAAEKVSVWVREWEKDRWTEGMSVRNVCFDMIFPVQYLIITSQHSFSPLLSAPHNTVWPHTYWSKDLLLCMLMPATHTQTLIKKRKKKEVSHLFLFRFPPPWSSWSLARSLFHLYTICLQGFIHLFLFIYIFGLSVWSGLGPTPQSLSRFILLLLLSPRSFCYFFLGLKIIKSGTGFSSIFLARIQLNRPSPHSSSFCPDQFRLETFFPITYVVAVYVCVNLGKNKNLPLSGLVGKSYPVCLHVRLYSLNAYCYRFFFPLFRFSRRRIGRHFEGTLRPRIAVR